jgi:rhamnulokinase
VDTWGVDYALLDRAGRLLGLPYMYRDSRTEGMGDVFCKTFGRRKLYDRTGIQFMDINTVFQLAAEARSADPLFPKAERLLMMPDLMNYWLCGVQANEATIASTGQCVDLATRAWAKDVLEAAGAPTRLFGELVRPGSVLGPVRGIAGLSAPVVTVGSHDTASAVAAVPAPKKQPWAYLATGTWALMGVELDAPILTDETYELSYTHEGGVSGNLRFLKNITGMWLVQELRRAWKAEGDDVDFDTLMQMAQASKPFASLIDPDDAPFGTPGDMPAKIAAYCRRTGQPVPESKGAFIRAAFEGIVLRYREVWGQLESITGVRRAGLNMIGGATKDPLHCQMTADALGVPVTCGPVEGAAMGNVLAQMLASGDIRSIGEGREIVRASTQLEVYLPRDPAPWQEAFGRWQAIKARR